MSSKSEVVDGAATAVDTDTDITATSPKPKDEKRESSRDKDKEKEKSKRSRPDMERSKSHRERDSKKDRDRERDRRSPKSTTSSFIFSSSSKLRPTDSETSRSSVRRAHSHHQHRSKTEEKSAVSEMKSDISRFLGLSLGGGSDRGSIPFSKSHNKESSGSREEGSSSQARKSSGSGVPGAIKANGDPLTPDATDLGSSSTRKKRSSHHRSKSADSVPGGRRSSTKSHGDGRPPSPPETDVTSPKPSSSLRPSRSHRIASSEADTITDDRPKSRVSELSRAESKLSRRRSSGSSRLSSHSTAVPRGSSSRDTLRVKESDRLSRSGSKSSKLSTSHSVSRRRSVSGSKKKSEYEDRHHRHSGSRRTSSPESAQDSSPKTPTQPQISGFVGSQIVEEIPRVDYLMQHGGLPHAVSKQFLSVLSQNRVKRTAKNVPALTGAESFFTPFFNLLDQYNAVIAKHGSIAVATGHRSVARRLLDRLEHVFSRELPSEGCSCVVCERSEAPHCGLNWGEVLEQVSGRGDLPSWPPFDMGSLGIKAVGSHIDPTAPPRPSSPINLDPDLNEEFREHYLRQTQKVRQSVDRWMTKCADAPAPPPTDVDDETLTFAILTNLSSEDKPYFNALLTGSKELQPALRAPTPLRKNRTEFVVNIGTALQRLYNLTTPPRDAETALYLLKHHETHDLLTTIAAINSSEWEILTSGRFDGFLWSGADNGDLSPGEFPISPDRADGVNSRMSIGGSRSVTPSQRPYSRSATATPASFVSNSTAGGTNKHAVSVDEEAEIAALNELELEIFNGMEALENAFETLHLHAQTVRNSLRQRSAGLTQSLKSRKRPEVLLGSGNSLASNYERPAWAQGTEGEDSDDDWADDCDMIAPDDSASNVASNRRHQHKRRQERRTPAPIEEEDEDY
ncbi:hypothetical protein CFIMG_006696RA [Ceratocystis fimbriata CBS 114723]|uniref:5-Methylcytosine G/T mismatch-specific DNA glycosylase n=1 Tax=Ceratocystis fimbriata CBS 114723 TaxID=1035309 RepID=A0A2C5WU38_9PEZI|nr:hypothetical protein CFIMG_006696RA [Ceratocystis fimbriata CBS 114723]